MKETKVKICGITNLEDAQNAIKYGADALGFVFYEKSPRYIEPEVAACIIKELPPFIEKIGLFVNLEADIINEISKKSHITLAQIHFDAQKRLYESLELPYIKVVRAKCKEDILKSEDSYRFVDSFVEEFGGVGKSIDLSWFDFVDCSKIILSGGLSISNLDKAKQYNFYGFDVSSGVELEKGLKDKLKMKEFIEKAKSRGW